MMRYTVVICQL